MLLTPHTLMGIAIATLVHNPVIAVPLAVASHFAADLTPHWDFYSHTSKEQRVKGWRPIAVQADFGVGIAVGVFFTTHALWRLHDPKLALSIFLCGIAAVIPDALEAPHIYMQEKEPAFTKFVYSIQHRLQFQAPLPWGIITQIIVGAVSLKLILG